MIVEKAQLNFRDKLTAARAEGYGAGKKAGIDRGYGMGIRALLDQEGVFAEIDRIARRLLPEQAQPE